METVKQPTKYTSGKLCKLCVKSCVRLRKVELREIEKLTESLRSIVTYNRSMLNRYLFHGNCVLDENYELIVT